MVDFLKITTRSPKRGVLEIYPKFIIKNTKDLMTRGGDFYAIWDESNGVWSKDEQTAINIIDHELKVYYENNKDKYSYYDQINIKYMWDSDSGTVDRFHKYCQKQMRANYVELDNQLIFSNMDVDKLNYSSKRLSYPLEECSIDAYDKLISTLYAKEEREKIEWAIGSIISGDSKRNQKFMVFYGAAGTGKSTILNIIQKLFNGYYCVFDAKALGSNGSAFALEAFRDNPLVAIQHDGDLSRIEDNTRINSIVSHEKMTVNEKFKSTYENAFKCFLFMGTNKPVKITDAKSGLLRRLIDVSPTGNKLSVKEYNKLMKEVDFELGGIAKHCLDYYLDNKNKYDSYVPVKMLGASNDTYNFVMDSYLLFKQDDATTLKRAWELYKMYCEDTNVPYKLSQRAFKEELKNYFKEYYDRYTIDNSRVRSYYLGFKTKIFDDKLDGAEKEPETSSGTSEWLELNSDTSTFDIECSDCFAQYANKNETPSKPWDKVKTTLNDLQTNKLHYVKVPENHIVIDFDLTDDSGNKSLELNMKAANSFPPTYAEVSKSGQGLHLHYIYTGDVSKLMRVYDSHIEIKVFTGKSSLRRKLIKCNELPITSISSGLPLKKGGNMVNFEVITSEKSIRRLIIRNLNKEIHPGTKPSIDFIHKILEDAYNNGVNYDVTDMRNGILAFAVSSTNHPDYCIKMVSDMKFKSEDTSEAMAFDKDEVVFFDVEVFPNLFLINWKKIGEGNKIVRMVNPAPEQVENLFHYKLVGFNNRRYDNHMLYARAVGGYNNEQLYKLSKKIVTGDKNAFFGEAYNISYTDIYDFCSEKMSLKKWEVRLGIHHKELGLPWDEPVPEEMWDEVAKYCDNDVIATEAVWNDRHSDFVAREILAEIAGGSVNDTTNSLTTKIIFGRDRRPQNQFNYRFLGNEEEIDQYYKVDDGRIVKSDEPTFTAFRKDGKPIYPGYKFELGKSTYRDEEPSEGGYAYATIGMHENVALLDITSMHPTCVIQEDFFGYYTAKFEELVQARVLIKHGDYDEARTMMNGVLTKYLTDEKSSKNLAKALKIAINSVYGLTFAKFDNPFKDKNNKDNFVAKRGALFMVNLKHEVENLGYTVAHIKTDSIKIPNADKKIIDFVMDYGKLYGYNFEHEATYKKMCLVNKSDYIAKLATEEECRKMYGYSPEDNTNPIQLWTATGAQFAVPYVFKTLFTHEDIVFDDLCETKEVKSSMYLDMNEDLPQLSKDEEKELGLITKAMKSSVGTAMEEVSKKLNIPLDDLGNRYNELCEKRDKAHNYIFVGKVGVFCPVKPNTGGGLLMRKKDENYYAVTGTKGYRWKESEILRGLGAEESIDTDYYNTVASEAIESISQYCDFEQFVE